MAISPYTADIVVKDMAASLAFYRLLGLDIPAVADQEEGPVNYEPGHGMALGFFTEAMMAHSPLGWVAPVGQRISIAFKAGSPAEVDAVYSAVEAAGHKGAMAPVDSPYGQRYACLRDPDGNRVDVFADIPPG